MVVNAARGGKAETMARTSIYYTGEEETASQASRGTCRRNKMALIGFSIELHLLMAHNWTDDTAGYGAGARVPQVVRYDLMETPMSYQRIRPRSRVGYKRML